MNLWVGFFCRLCVECGFSVFSVFVSCVCRLCVDVCDIFLCLFVWVWCVCVGVVVSVWLAPRIQVKNVHEVLILVLAATWCVVVRC